MPSDKNDKNEVDLDVRILRRNIQKGIVTQKELDKIIESLPDAKPNVAEPERDD